MPIEKLGPKARSAPIEENARRAPEGEGRIDKPSKKKAEAPKWVPKKRETQIDANEIRALSSAAPVALAPPPGPRDGKVLELGSGWTATKMTPDEFAQKTGRKVDWGDVFAVTDPTGKESFEVKHGFAMAYLSTAFPETGGHDAAWFLGRPLENEHTEQIPGTNDKRAVQRFERGSLMWTESTNLTQLLPNRVAPRELRFRFAPSPTGHLHIGGAYVALKNYMAAKQAGGKFFLRIEDTDTVRSKDEYTKAIKQGLTWLGISYEDDVAHQSKRTELYKSKIQQLVKEDKAYVGEGGAIFFRMPKEGKVVVNDVLRGRVQVNVSAAGMSDYCIQRKDGTPTFLLANVIDDGDQGITHVIRGVDHLSNAAKQVPLFQALGYQVPDFFHVPLIHGDDGKKLSKRHGATSVMDFQREGFDPNVLVNHLARLGFGFSTDETAALNDLITEFDPHKIGKSKSQIGYDALYARNRDYMSHLPVPVIAAELTARAEQVEVPYEDGTVKSFASLLGPLGIEALADASRGRASTYQESLDLGMMSLAPPDMLASDIERFTTPEILEKIRPIAKELEGIAAGDWSLKRLEQATAKIDKNTMLALRWMLTGAYEGFPMKNIIPMLGKEETLFRLKSWIEKPQ
jgi:glutamyl-tRNA synthetase